MKAHRKTRRALSALTIVGCIGALALPVAAGARPIIYHQIGHPALTPAYVSQSVPSTLHPHGRPAAYAGAAAPYTLPSDYATDTQSGAGSTTTASTPNVVVRVVHSVTNGPDHTLAIVLASCALGIALCGSGYAVFRTTRLQRRLPTLGS